MGALTLKNFPFELRRWDIEKFESIDPTDSFGCNTRTYTCKNQIIQIEPGYNNYNNWLSDKGRHFFDAVFNNTNLIKTKTLFKLMHKIIKAIYIFDHCNSHSNQSNFFTIIFGNVSVEILNTFLFISQNYLFIKLRKTESLKINTNLESCFQLNSAHLTKLSSSTLALLISTNPRYEGYFLNLTLRQRILKGNFKCLAIGSLINLTFPLLVLGSNFSIIKTIIAGNNLICQNLKIAKNPVLIYNYELLKWTDNINEMFKILNYLSIFNNSWNGLKLLNSSLNETGTFMIFQVSKLNLKDLNNFSFLYFTNVTTHITSNLKKITELKLLKLKPLNTKLINFKLFIDQNYKINQNYTLSNKILFNYLYLPNSTFFENCETFINTEGFIKWSTKLVVQKNKKNTWQILRKLLKHLKKKLYFLTNNKTIMFNFKKNYNFKNFINFQYYPALTLTNLNFYLHLKNKTIKLNKNRLNFKLKEKKFINSKIKYWLDDFFTGGKDEYSWNSLVLNKFSKTLRLGCTNFF